MSETHEQYMSDRAQKRERMGEIRKEIAAYLKKLYPQYFDYEIGREIVISVSAPREGMGRFSEPKLTWTIDIENKVTYARKKQVRVAVDKDGKWTFDEAKLVEKIDECLEEIKAKRAGEGRARMANEVIPKNLPPGLNVTANPCGYTATYSVRLQTVEEMQNLVTSFRTFLNQIEPK